jgi:hypothetical protein
VNCVAFLVTLHPIFEIKYKYYNGKYNKSTAGRSDYGAEPESE